MDIAWTKHVMFYICNLFDDTVSNSYCDGFEPLTADVNEELSRALLAVCFILVSCLAISYTQKTEEATPSSETPIDFRSTTRRYISEGRTQLILCWVK
jgi:hypothetical protein